MSAEQEQQLAHFETKLLIAELRKRRGHNPVQMEEFCKLMEDLSVGDLGELKRQVEHIWNHKVRNLQGLTAEEHALLDTKDFMGCIRSIQSRTGVGIATAKELLDQWRGKR